MSFFHPRSTVSPFVSEPSFTPLFRLLEDFDTYSRGPSSNNNNNHANHRSTALKSFQPRFDVKEVEGGYELHGDLPGIEQKDVEIEFTDAQTLSIRGRTERHYEEGTRPAALEASAPQATITEGGEQATNTNNSHRATAEDDPDEPATPPNETQQQQVVQHQDKSQAQAQDKQQNTEAETPKHKYWLSERSVGEFNRSFTFPGRVDQESVTATMKNGVLSILVPKAKKLESRRITIS